MSPMAGDGEGSLARAAKEDEAAAAAGEHKNRLSKGDIRWILSHKPRARFAELKRGNPELIPRPDEEADEDRKRLYRLAKAFYETQESLPWRQERVRREMETKGYVELDDETARRRAEAQAVVDREWPDIEAMTKSLILPKNDCRGGEGGDESDSEGWFGTLQPGVGFPAKDARSTYVGQISRGRRGDPGGGGGSQRSPEGTCIPAGNPVFSRGRAPDLRRSGGFPGEAYPDLKGAKPALMRM